MEDGEVVEVGIPYRDGGEEKMRRGERGEKDIHAKSSQKVALLVCNGA